MSIKNTRFTPQRRGPSLRDGAGGTSERSEARERDPVLRNVGAKVEDIRSLGIVDVTLGTTPFYDLGRVDQFSVGRYTCTRQGTASSTAEPLGATVHCEYMIRESAAGVFQAVTRTDDEGGTATSDADDPSASDTTITAVADATLDGAGSDSRSTIFVATAADVTDAAAWTAGKTLVLGNLYILDALAANHVHTVTRLE